MIHPDHTYLLDAPYYVRDRRLGKNKFEEFEE